MKPVQLVDPRDEGLRDFLRKAEVLIVEGEGMEDEGGEDGPASDDE